MSSACFSVRPNFRYFDKLNLSDEKIEKIQRYFHDHKKVLPDSPLEYDPEAYEPIGENEERAYVT